MAQQQQGGPPPDVPRAVQLTENPSHLELKRGVRQDTHQHVVFIARWADDDAGAGGQPHPAAIGDMILAVDGKPINAENSTCSPTAILLLAGSC